MKGPLLSLLVAARRWFNCIAMVEESKNCAPQGVSTSISPLLVGSEGSEEDRVWTPLEDIERENQETVERLLAEDDDDDDDDGDDDDDEAEGGVGGGGDDGALDDFLSDILLQGQQQKSASATTLGVSEDEAQVVLRLGISYFEDVSVCAVRSFEFYEYLSGGRCRAIFQFDRVHVFIDRTYYCCIMCMRSIISSVFTFLPFPINLVFPLCCLLRRLPGR